MRTLLPCARNAFCNNIRTERRRSHIPAVVKMRALPLHFLVFAFFGVCSGNLTTLRRTLTCNTRDDNRKGFPLETTPQVLLNSWDGHNKWWTTSLFRLFVNVTGVSPGCRTAFKTHLIKAAANELNSLKMLDATAKLPAGILKGNINQYGDFDECLEVPEAHYCLALIDPRPLWRRFDFQHEDLAHAHFSIRDRFEDPGHRVPGFSLVRWGFCLPEQCGQADLENALGLRVRIKPNMCQKGGADESRYWTLMDWIARGYFVALLSLVAIATYSYRKPFDSRLLDCFALQRNWQELISVARKPHEYPSLHGVRFLSALSLLMAHKTMALLYNPYMNRTWMAEVQAMGWSVIGRNAIIYTDCFLLISGLLNANALLVGLERNGTMDFKRKLVGRLFRILPGLCAVILFSTYILPHLGSGPVWPLVIGHHAGLCKKSMWRNFLFIHNYFGFDAMCLTHTHQLGIDMQLFLATPIFVYVLWRWRTYGLYLGGLVAFGSTLLRFYSTFAYDLSHVVHFGIPMFDTADYSYILPTHRATIYFMGVMLAWCLRYEKPLQTQSKNTLRLIWSIVYAIGLSTWFAPFYMSVRGYQYSRLQAAFYGAVYPMTWGGAVAWIIFAIESPKIGCWLAPVLSWKYFQIFTRIAYGTYLIQFPVFFYNVGATRHVGQYAHYMMFPPVEMAVVIFLSILFALFVEMPFSNLYRQLI